MFNLKFSAPMLSEESGNNPINSMFHSGGFKDKNELSYDDFKTMMKEFKGDFLAIGLDCKGAKQNYLDSTTNVARMQSFGVDAAAHRHRSKLMKHWDTWTNFLEENRQHIFFLFVFYVITIALFVERFIFYSFMAGMVIGMTLLVYSILNLTGHQQTTKY